MPRPAFGFGCAGSATTARNVLRPARLLGQMALVIGLDAAHVAARAFEGPAVLSVEAGVAATDNGNSAAPGERQADVLLSLRPDVRWKRRGPGLDVDLDAAAIFLGHSTAAHRGRVLPDLRASLRSTLVDQWLFVDAAARVKQTEADPYGTRAEDSRSANRRTEGSYSVRPHVERLLAPDTLLLGAYDAALTTNGAGVGARAVTRRGAVRVERVPVPFGAALEWSRLDTESRRAERSRLTDQTVRVEGSVALANEWVLGAVAGQERSRFLGGEHTDLLYGVDLKWQPTPRTSVSAHVERRFFGIGGTVTATHRTPYLSMGLGLSRQPALASSALHGAGSAGDIRTYLDAILKTRYPDTGVRDAVVDSLVRNQGLDTHVATASTIVADYPQLQTEVNAHLALLGRRDTLAVTVFARTARLLTHRDELVGAGVPIADDSRQVGASFQLNHRLTPQVSADAVVRRSRIVGLAERSGDVSNETVYRFTLLRHVTEQYALSAGLQHNRFATNVEAQSSYQATTVFLGASYQF